MLVVTRGASTRSGLGIVRPHQVQKIRTPQPRGPVCQPILIDEQGKCDTRLFLKKPRIVPIAQPHRRQFCTFVLECGLVFAQLRDVLTAEDSSVVTEEDDHRGLVFP
jgi:hypothetical protein